MNCCLENAKMGVPPGNRRVLVPRRTERYVAGADTRGRQAGRLNPRSQQAIHEISGLGQNQSEVIDGKGGYNPTGEGY